MPNTIEIGNITIQQIVEQQEPLFGIYEFLPDLDPEILEEHRHWLEPRFLDPKTQKFNLCIQSYLVRTPHHTILIDSCVGNHKHRPIRPMWHMYEGQLYEKNFKAAGVTFEEIDYVMCTHLHTDHVGWNTKMENGRWVPTFPNAKYVFAERELEYWTEICAKDSELCPWMIDSVFPILEAKKAEIVKSDHWLNDLVQLIPSPGHTIDHFCVQVGKPGQDALITGDMVHTPLQCLYPELGMFSDYDSSIAGNTRRELFGRFCDTSTLMCTAHFPDPSTGHLTRRGDGFWIG